MPIRIPEVNGTPARPAASIAASRTAGSLSGQPWCGPPGSQSRAATDSSIIPCETLTFRSRRDSSSDSTPALTWGSSPVSASTSAHIAARYSTVEP